LADVTYEELGLLADTIFLPTTPFYSRIDQAITKYPYDPRRTEELMREAGITRGPGGGLENQEDGKLSLEILSSAGPLYDSQRTIIADGWRQAGLEVRERLASNQASDRAQDSQFPSMRVSPTGLQEEN